MGVIIDHHGWRQTAAPEAPDRFKGKLPVPGDASHLQAEFLFNLIQDLLASFDITGRPKADPDDMFSPWDCREECIKGDDSVDLRRREVQPFCNSSLHLFWQVATDVLAFFERRDKGPVFSLYLEITWSTF